MQPQVKKRFCSLLTSTKLFFSFHFKRQRKDHSVLDAFNQAYVSDFFEMTLDIFSFFHWVQELVDSTFLVGGRELPSFQCVFVNIFFPHWEWWKSLFKITEMSRTTLSHNFLLLYFLSRSSLHVFLSVFLYTIHAVVTYFIALCIRFYLSFFCLSVLLLCYSVFLFFYLSVLLYFCSSIFLFNLSVLQSCRSVFLFFCLTVFYTFGSSVFWFFYLSVLLS